MKTIFQLSFLFLTALNATGYGDYLAVKLEPTFSYQDIDKSCILQLPWSRDLDIHGRVEGDKVVEATISDAGTFVKKIDFLPSELIGLKVQKDVLGKYYFSELALSSRLLKWFFFNINGGEIVGPSFCMPPKALSTVTPETYTYVFTQKEANEYFSRTQRFSGQRVDGEPYKVVMGFIQFVVN